MSDFDGRYLLARYPTGGVVVDLESGNYYRVNGSAALVCDALRAGADVEGRIARELGVPHTEAARMVANVTAGLTVPAVRDTPQGSYHFHPAPGGYVLRNGARTVLEVEGTDLSIRLPPDGEAPKEIQVEVYVRALAPKLLFQRGVTVLHASACMAAGRLIAFAGVSGAGKTTTARAFAKAGADLVSEDLVVLAPEAKQATILTEAEPFIFGWARRVGFQLLSEPRKPVPSDALQSLVDGPAAQLDQIFFLDRTRRAGNEFTISPLAEPDALISLMTHDFLGAVEPEAWRRFFDRARTLVELADLRKATPPDGVDRLAQAAARYISRTVS
jgi:hypothetical protein